MKDEDTSILVPLDNMLWVLQTLINGSKCTTSTADWPMHESYWTIMTHGKGHVDLNIRDDEDGLHLIVYQASDDGSETNCCDDKTWRVFDLVERETN